MCQICAPGWYQMYSASSNCIQCSNGSYQMNKGMTMCNDCAPGFYARLAGASVCEICMPGLYQMYNASTNCSKCSEGYYQSASGASVCNICGYGMYSNSAGGTQCDMCPSDYNNNRTGGRKTEDCYIICMPGEFLVNKICTGCEAGTYQISTIATACVACDAGTFSDVTRSTACQACHGCTEGQWASASCMSTRDTQCSPCTICNDGYYVIGSCAKGDNMGLLSQDTLCDVCPMCKNGTFLSAGCMNNDPPVCLACSNCTGDVVLTCTSNSDTVCSDVVSCRRNVNYTVYDWITEAERCTMGQYLVGMNGGLPVCRQCPVGLFGPNGLWCEACNGYKRAYLDGTACVCEIGTQMNSRGLCVCGVGMEFMEDGCVVCGVNRYSNYSMELGDSWFNQYKPCAPCEAGKYSLTGMTACLDCEFGSYREVDMDACGMCEDGYFAEDARVNNCTQCNSTCEVGFNPVSCPLYPGDDLFICEPCPEIPINAVLTPAANFTGNTACDWECEDGYFRLNSTYCQLCSEMACSPGFNVSLCSRLADANCDVECVDDRKPLFNSQ